MRKLFISIIFIISLCSLFLYMSCNTSNYTGLSNSVYYISSNENKVFGTSLYNIDISSENYAFPFKEDVLSLMNNDSIKAVYPYYPLRIDDFNWEKPSLITVYQDGKELQYSIPYSESIDGVGMINSINVVHLKSYVESNHFLYGNTVIKEFDSNSGIYISEYLYESLNLDCDKQLIIKAEVLVPTVAKVTTEHVVFTNPDDFDEIYREIDEYQEWYKVTEYVRTEYTLEIQGVIGSTKTTINGPTIAIPYEIASNIYDSVSKEFIELAQGEVLWTPVTYLLECTSVLPMDDLAMELSDDLKEFTLADYNDEFFSRKSY